MDLLTPQEAAARLRVTPRTIKRWTEDGVLACVTLPSGRVRIPTSAIEALIAGPTEPLAEAAS